MNISNPGIANLFLDVNGGLYQWKVLDIGSWDMDTDHLKEVTHNITVSDVRSIEVLIRRDNLVRVYPIHHTDIAAGVPVGTVPSGAARCESVEVKLTNTVGGYFDDVNFDDPFINRGWIILKLAL